MFTAFDVHRNKSFDLQSGDAFDCFRNGLVEDPFDMENLKDR